MPTIKLRVFYVVSLSLILAMGLRIMPLPKLWFQANPDWVALVLLYWTMAIPERVGLGTVWLVGLLTDVLIGRVMGQHALAYTVSAYFGLRLYQRLRLYPLPQQSLWIMLFLLINQLLIFWTQSLGDTPAMNWVYWMPSLTGAMGWPLVLILLRRIRRYYGIS
ncbi:rod shape-determining protein MreD [Candidatus Woesearchaeota archaeon]|nr:rod shape-determining protein MreD [Candidatus Woesearchaeota archaeon]